MTLSGLRPAAQTALAFTLDFEPDLGDFRADVLAGLGQAPKTLSPKYFYDERGSALFDGICAAPEYYPTRTETAILRAAAPAIADFAGPDAAVIELGAGSAVKVRILLDALDAPALFVAQDISKEHLIAAAGDVSAEYPNTRVGAVVSDFTQPVSLPDDVFDGASRRLAFFPGSTMGNFAPDEADLIWDAARGLLRPGDGFLLGVDLVKDVPTMLAAYDDAGGVTAAFNLNMLARINTELGGDIRIDQFRHKSIWNDALSRIEMHLESLKDQAFTVAGQSFSMTQGETIHTENSHKFTVERVLAKAAEHDFVEEQVWTNPDKPFGVFLLRAV